MLFILREIEEIDSHEHNPTNGLKSKKDCSAILARGLLGLGLVDGKVETTKQLASTSIAQMRYCCCFCCCCMVHFKGMHLSNNYHHMS